MRHGTSYIITIAPSWHYVIAILSISIVFYIPALHANTLCSACANTKLYRWGEKASIAAALKVAHSTSTSHKNILLGLVTTNAAAITTYHALHALTTAGADLRHGLSLKQKCALACTQQHRHKNCHHYTRPLNKIVNGTGYASAIICVALLIKFIADHPIILKCSTQEELQRSIILTYSGIIGIARLINGFIG